MDKAVVIAAILISMVVFFPGCIRIGENLPPEPDLKASATFIDVNETVIFSANDSFDRDGEITKYYWDFDDGTNASTPYVSHDYEKGGNYTVVLIITDNEDKKAVLAMTVHVNELPVPLINISHPVYIHETVNFWANDSYDPDGYVTDYFWDFGDGTSETGMIVSHVYTSKGLLNVTLTVTDNDGAKAAITRNFWVQFRTYQVTWDTDIIEAFDSEGDNYTWEIEHPLGKSEYLKAKITGLNITKIIFNLTWIDDIHLDPPLGGPNDEFVLNITSPNGEMYQGGPGTSEKIIVNAPENGYINPLPPTIEGIEAESKKSLEMLLAQNYTSGEGRGDWVINITLTQAEGYAGGPVDNGNSWRLIVVYVYYSPLIKKL